MPPMTVEEMGQIITDFMGMECMVDKDSHSPEYYWVINGEQYNLFYPNSGLHWTSKSTPPFHSSWDWLHPAYYKFRTIDYQTGFQTKELMELYLLKRAEISSEMCRNETPGIACKKLAEAIQWYNNNHKK